MNGQWAGENFGTNPGDLRLNIDDKKTHFEGYGLLYDHAFKLPGSYFFIKTKNRDTKFTQDLFVKPLDPKTGNVIDRLPTGSDVIFPDKVTAEFEFADDQLKVNWQSSIPTNGSSLLQRSKAGDRSKLRPLLISTWDEFKKEVSKRRHYRFIYRGQNNNKWRLRTHFHRTGRADLMRFLNEDVRILHQHITPQVRHFYNLANPLENASFCSLAQHHGYPTPLLDWTYSPFIAAFFAFRDLPKSGFSQKDKVRILLFDKDRWCTDWPQLPRLDPARPHFSIVEPIPIDNARILPQQGLSSVTNIDDIETYIATKGKYLEAIDLPANERDRILSELSLMGVNAGSLFPGIDGVCEQLKGRFFD